MALFFKQLQQGSEVEFMSDLQILPLRNSTQRHSVQIGCHFNCIIIDSNLVQEIEHSLKRIFLYIALLFHCEEELREKLQNRWPACSREVPSLPPLVKHKKHRQPHFEVDGAKVVQVKTIKK